MHLEHYEAIFPGDSAPSIHTAVHFDASEQRWRQALQDWARLGSVPFQVGSFPDRLIFPNDYDMSMIEAITSRAPTSYSRATEDIPANPYV